MPAPWHVLVSLCFNLKNQHLASNTIIALHAISMKALSQPGDVCVLISTAHQFSANESNQIKRDVSAVQQHIRTCHQEPSMLGACCRHWRTHGHGLGHQTWEHGRSMV